MAQTAPPGPRGVPLLGNTLQWLRGPFEFRQRCAEKYGDVVEIEIAGLSLYMLTDPDDIERVLVHENESFVKPDVVQDNLEDVFGYGLLVSEGEFWRRQRGIAQQAFYRNRIESYTEAMVERACELRGTWSDGETVDVYHEMSKLAFQVLADTIFGTELAYERDRIGESLSNFYAKFKPTRQAMSIFVPDWVPTPANRRYARAVEHLDGIIDRMIEQRRNEPSGDDLLSILIDADVDSGGMSNQTIRDELMNMLLAGHETTAVSLTAIWYLLGQHPQAVERLQAELDSVLGEEPPTVADLPDLPYTQGIVKESLRLYPPVYAVPRQTTTDVEIGGYHIPEGSYLSLTQKVVHRDPQWFDEPEAFRPERWTAEFEEQLHEYAYFPFGGGPRRCLGNHFTMIEEQLVVAALASRFELRHDHDGPMEMGVTGFTSYPKGTVEMTVHDRHETH